MLKEQVWCGGKGQKKEWGGKSKRKVRNVVPGETGAVNAGGRNTVPVEINSR